MSIVKVAKLAGVSHATVSRVINHRTDVSPETARRVRDAMEQLQYVPSAKRRGPKPKSSGIRTGNIGMLFFGETPTLAASPVAALVLHVIQDRLASNGFNLMLGQVSSSSGLPPIIANGQVDGLFLHGSPPPSDIRQQLSRYSACVWLLSQRQQLGYWGDRVAPDDLQIGTTASRYLIDRGHRRIAAIHCDATHLGFSTRTQGFQAEARKADIPFFILANESATRATINDSARANTQFDELIDQLVSTDGPMPTGLFIPRDALTIRMYRALRMRGIKPGRDIEIVSCDNIPALEGLDPRPATMDIQPEEIGRRAVEQLLWHIRDRHAPMSVTSLVEPILVRGDKVDVVPPA